MAIFKKKAECFNVNINDEVVDYIAQNVVSNIRELEAFLSRVIAFSKINNSHITVDFVLEILNK